MTHFKPKKPTINIDAILAHHRQTAHELRATLTAAGIDDPVSVLYRYPAPGRVEGTVRVGRTFNDSGYWFVREVL